MNCRWRKRIERALGRLPGMTRASELSSEALFVDQAKDNFISSAGS